MYRVARHPGGGRDPLLPGPTALLLISWPAGGGGAYPEKVQGQVDIASQQQHQGDALVLGQKNRAEAKFAQIEERCPDVAV